MNKNTSTWQMAGFIFISLAGTLLHFTFDLAGRNPVVAIFSPVNESIWEHLKLLYFPMLVFAIVEYFFIGRNIIGFWCVNLMGILLGILLIPTIYYTYTGIFGRLPDWINIALFFVVAAIVYRTEVILLKMDTNCPQSAPLSLIFLILIGIIFVTFTFSTPQIPLFQDPVTGQYGYQS